MKNRIVWNREHTEAGQTTGGIRVCTLEGCGGSRIHVRWPDGKLTVPCLRGMKRDATGEYQIK